MMHKKFLGSVKTGGEHDYFNATDFEILPRLSSVFSSALESALSHSRLVAGEMLSRRYGKASKSSPPSTRHSRQA
jgi:hypothetical protein